MIAVHGETLWSPAPQPMDDDELFVHVSMVYGLGCVIHKRAIMAWIIYVLEKDYLRIEKDYLRLGKTIYGFKKTIYSLEVISVE